MPCSNLKSLNRWETSCPLWKERDSGSIKWCWPKLVQIEQQSSIRNTRVEHFTSACKTHFCFIKWIYIYPLHCLHRKLVNYISSGPVLAMELLAPSAIRYWRVTLGPTDPVVARSDAPNTVRALFGKDTTYNAAHGSDSPEAASRVSCSSNSVCLFMPLNIK